MKLFRNSLGWRLYAVGVVQLVLVAAAAVLLGYLLQRFPDRTDVRAVATRLTPLLRTPSELQRRLDDLRKHDGLELSVYDESDRLVASNVQPALPLPRWGRASGASENDGAAGASPPPRFDGPPQHMHHEFPPPFGPPPPFFGSRGFGPPPGEGGPPGPPPDMFTRLAFAGGEGVLVARPSHRGPSPLPPLLTLLSGLVVVGAGAFLTTRWISRPLAQLSRAARALGRGELGARTDLKRPDELGEVGMAFDEMASRLTELVLAEKELLANVSHELRTPLARIRVALEIASEGDAETARASLGEIAVDLAELETLIDDVMATTRLAVASRTAIPAGLAIHREEVSASAICERAAERFRARHPGRPFELLAPEGPLELEADPTWLRRVLDNLLENAHKYSPGPSEKVTLGAARKDEDVVFSVTDSGMGITEEDLPRIFDPFFRSERSRSRGTGGVGLGLTLAKRIVEAHGGKISVESRKGSGTVVRASIPIRSVHSGAAISS